MEYKIVTRFFKKVKIRFFIYFLFLIDTKSNAQVNWEGGSLPSFRFTPSAEKNNNRNDNSGNNIGYSEPHNQLHLSSQTLGKAFKDRAEILLKDGVKSCLEKEWGKAIRKFKAALVYAPKDSNIEENLDRAQAYEESDKADQEFQKKSWSIKEIESALKHYQKAHEYLPNDKYINGCIQWTGGLKNLQNNKFDDAIENFRSAKNYFKDEDNKKKLIDNITITAYRQVKETANFYLSSHDWVNAAAYLNVANKDFDNKIKDEADFAKAYNEVGKISNGYYLYNKKVEEIKNNLPAEIKKNW